jgi:hypothetical protein
MHVAYCNANSPFHQGENEKHSHPANIFLILQFSYYTGMPAAQLLGKIPIFSPLTLIFWAKSGMVR